MAIVESIQKLGENIYKKNNNVQLAFESVAVIGAAGQIGELFTRSLAPITHVDAVVKERRWKDEPDHPEIKFHDSIEAMLKTEPEAVILATPNPADQALKQVAQYVQRPGTLLILPQNGVAVVPQAEKIIATSTTQISLVRASLFTNVSRDSEGNIAYNPRKNRIALAPVGDDQPDVLLKAEDMFKRAGFDVRVAADYSSMEWSKLIINLLGTTSTITGLTPLEAFSDPEIFALEMRALKDRFAILKAAGINIDSSIYIGQLRWLAQIPELISSNFRRVVAKSVAEGRNNQPPAAARQLKAGARIVESGTYFHKPIVDLGEKHGLRSPVDEAELDILRRHERTNNDFSLASFDEGERRRLLLETMKYETRHVFVSSSTVVRFAANKLFDLMAKSFTIKGAEHLQAAEQCLAEGKSVQINPNHRSHTDHEALMKALREVIPGVLSRYPVYILANTKFDTELLSGLLSKAYPHPVVYKLGEEDSEEVRWKAQIINRRSAKVVEDLLKNPCIFVVYLEGGRSKIVEDGKVQLQRAAPGSSSWISNSKFGLSIPTVITGTEKMLPPGKNLPRRGANIIVEFCEPIDTAALRTQGLAVPIRERGDRFYSDIVLGKAAEKLDPSERGYYSR